MRLNRREQRAALVAVILLSVGVLYGFVLKPTLTRTETLRRVIGDKRQQLQELRARGERYVALSQGYRDLQQQILLIDPNQELLLMLDSIIQQRNLKPHLTKMEGKTIPLEGPYTEIQVETTLEDISFKQLVLFLEAIETAPTLARVQRLYLKPDQQHDHRLYATLTITQPRFDESDFER